MGLNDTDVDEFEKPANNLLMISILSYTFLCVVTFGIGSSVALPELMAVLRTRKLAIAVGLAVQYTVMPSAARLVTSLLDMPAVDALGVILIACCPGGAASNAFAYFARADMALSITMTAVSNALAFATVPLFLLLWTQGLDSSVDIQVPFVEIALSLLMVLVPAALGVMLRHHRPKLAKRAEQLGAISAVVLILTSAFVGVIQNREYITATELFPWKNGVSVFLVSPVGMLCGLLALQVLNVPRVQKSLQLTRTSLPVVATVVMEIGIQNTVLALAIVALMTRDWGATAALRMQLIPIMWGIAVSLEAVVVMLFFRKVIGKASDRAFTTPEPSNAAL